VLAEEPESRRAIEAMLDSHSRQDDRFGLVTTIAVVAAALVVLQTRVRFERDKKGGWSVVVYKKGASDGLLKAVVSLARKLLGLGA